MKCYKRQRVKLLVYTLHAASSQQFLCQVLITRKGEKGGKNVLSLIGKVSKTWKIFLDLKRKGIDLH